jgi:hypothetical protein
MMSDVSVDTSVSSCSRAAPATSQAKAKSKRHAKVNPRVGCEDEASFATSDSGDSVLSPESARIMQAEAQWQEASLRRKKIGKKPKAKATAKPARNMNQTGAAAKAKPSEEESRATNLLPGSAKPANKKTAAKSKLAARRPRVDTSSRSPDGGESVGTSDDADMQSESTSRPMPASSGLLDFCIWMLGELTEQERAIAATKWTQTFSELCAGMGTGIMCYEALRMAFAHYDLDIEARCVCCTEMLDWKARALPKLASSLRSQGLPPTIFKTTGALTRVPLRDIDGKIVHDKPTCGTLLYGIVCTDISGLTTTPKSALDPGGDSGQSLLEFFAYLEDLEFEERPKEIILECVLKLMQIRRKGLPMPERGTDEIIKRLRGLGYVGRFNREDPRRFYLSSDRPRTWGLFLKAKLEGCPFDVEEVLAQNITQAMSILEKLRTPCREPFTTLLDRLDLSKEAGPSGSLQGANVAAERTSKRSRAGSAPSLLKDLHWMGQHEAQRAMKLMKLTPADVQSDESLEQFVAAASPLLTESQLRKALLRLAGLKKKGKMLDWREEVFTMNPTESPYRQGFRRNSFTCVLPSHMHLISRLGSLTVADGRTCLAMQGIQDKELATFPTLNQFTSRQQQDLAGHAFTANVCAAYILAAAIVR